MPLTPEEFVATLDDIRGMLADQGTRVRRMVESAVDGLFSGDHDTARAAVELDDEIDRIDVEVEQRAVGLLVRAAADTVPLDEQPLRSLLTLVKVNNEFERIADCGVTIAERTLALAGSPEAFPPTTRVLTNSMVGILRDIARAFKDRDPRLARLVLQSEGAVVMFKSELMKQTEQAVAAGDMTPRLAFDVSDLAGQCLLIADHATNVAEQVIYESTGQIVRHREGKWYFDADGDVVSTDGR